MTGSGFDLSPRATPRRPAEAAVPMINVVFLLLIFFLISAQLTPPDPVPITPPRSEAAPVALGPSQLFLSADGVLYGASGPLSETALGLADLAGPVSLKADGQVAGARLAQVLALLADAGQSDIRILVAAP